MKHKYTIFILLLTILILFLSAANLLTGSVDIPASEIIKIISGDTSIRRSWEYIILESRIPQCITAILCGAALSASGLMLQTAFCNPLADSSILGVSTGASLGVAVIMLASGGSVATIGFIEGSVYTVIIGAFTGASLVLALLLLLSSILRNPIMLLVAGIMIGYIVSSAISLLNFFASSEGIQSYVIWGMGNFGGVSSEHIPLFASIIVFGLILALLMIKPLNALLLGTRYAENLGINIKRTRNMLLFTTGILTATTTAFCGPIAFIGLAVPHIARLTLGTSNHNILMPATMLYGSTIALTCNLICILPGEYGIIPLNAVTPIIGAPVIIYVLLNQRKIQYFN